MQVDAGMTENSRQILVTAVETGSPAAGKLLVGDVIRGVFDKPFTDDARKVFGRAIGQAESDIGGGQFPLMIWRKGQSLSVVLELQILGTDSDTSPYNCPKAKKILEQGLVALVKQKSKDNGLFTNELALLAAGRPEDLEMVRKSARHLASKTPAVEALWQDARKGATRTWC